MSIEANKAVARRYFEEFLNQGRGVGGENLFAPTYQCHFPGRPGPLDKQEHDHLSITFLSAFPDGHFTVEDMIAEGDKVVSRYTFRGTHQEAWILLGPSPTGKWITLTGNEIHRIADGRIVEQWSQFDPYGPLQQIGAVPSPEQ